MFRDYLGKAYAPRVLAQILGWREWIDSLDCSSTSREFLRLALVSLLEEVSLIRKHGSHYRFMTKEDSVGLAKLNIELMASDGDIRPVFLKRLGDMISDAERVRFPDPLPHCEVLIGDARSFHDLPKADAVITSPPYLNRNNYIAQQKAELSLLQLLPDYQAYRQLVKGTFRSHVESDFGNAPHTTIPEVADLLASFELSENNNSRIPHMIAGYFEDMKITIETLAEVVRPGARLAFVVGNSRWGGVVVPVDHLLALTAERAGFSVERILVTREKGNSPQQMRRYGRIPVRESIVLFTRS
jgi:hypothetical protein